MKETNIDYTVKSKYSRGLIKVILMFYLIASFVLFITGCLELLGIHNIIGYGATITTQICFLILFIIFYIIYALTNIWKLEVSGSEIVYTSPTLKKYKYDIKDISKLKRIKYFGKYALEVYFNNEKGFIISTNCIPGFRDFVNECTFYGKKIEK